jgi:4-hydroxy-tetrahydrodipicolinate synthase
LETTRRIGLRDRPLVMHGLFPATVTPFTSSLAIDFKALGDHLCEMATTPGVAGIVVNSGIGERIQLTLDECDQCIAAALRARRPDQVIVAGIDGRSTADYVNAGRRARAAGAQALLVMPPFDVRPYRRMAAHAPTVHAFFATLDREVGLPMVVFQYPPNSGCAYPNAVLRALCDIPNVVAVKVATMGDMKAYAEVWDAFKDDLAILAGVDSPPLIDMLRHGAHGALIGISAMLPEVWADLLRLVREGDQDAADRLYDRVCLPLMASVFENQQPNRLSSEIAATKEALVMLGRIPNALVRPFALGVDDAARSEIHAALLGAGLLHSAAAE